MADAGRPASGASYGEGAPPLPGRGGVRYDVAMSGPYPKIELHVHLEATVRPARLLEIARRNDVRLPAKTEAGLARFCRFKDFDHFIRVWINDHEGPAS